MNTPSSAPSCMRAHDIPLLYGDLASFPLADVLQWVATWEGEGVLVLRRHDGALHGWLHCRAGSVEAVGAASDAAPPAPSGGEPSRMTPVGEQRQASARGGIDPVAWEAHAQRLGGHLVARGQLAPPQLRFALAVQASAHAAGIPPLPLGRLLTRAGYVREDALREALRRIAFDQVLACFSLHQGTFTLQPGQPSEQGVPLGERVAPLLLRAMEAWDAAAPPAGSEMAEPAGSGTDTLQAFVAGTQEMRSGLA